MALTDADGLKLRRATLYSEFFNEIGWGVPRGWTPVNKVKASSPIAKAIRASGLSLGYAAGDTTLFVMPPQTPMASTKYSVRVTEPSAKEPAVAGFVATRTAFEGWFGRIIRRGVIRRDLADCGTFRFTYSEIATCSASAKGATIRTVGGWCLTVSLPDEILPRRA